MVGEDVLALNVSSQLMRGDTSGRRWRSSLSKMVWSVREVVMRHARMARGSHDARMTGVRIDEVFGDCQIIYVVIGKRPFKVLRSQQK
jgi:hypothetical protein